MTETECKFKVGDIVSLKYGIGACYTMVPTQLLRTNKVENKFTVTKVYPGDNGFYMRNDGFISLKECCEQFKTNKEIPECHKHPARSFMLHSDYIKSQDQSIKVVGCHIYADTGSSS